LKALQWHVEEEFIVMKSHGYEIDESQELLRVSHDQKLKTMCQEKMIIYMTTYCAHNKITVHVLLLL